jgi:peptide/nickel transport system substrate-binding protein
MAAALLAANGTAAAKGTAAARGATATWAEPAGTAPDYIFPFMGRQFFTVGNVQHFQQLMYRPLYWFGPGASTTPDPALSLAGAPSYADGDKQVTVDLKPYRWSNGTRVTAEDVMFWMNMLHAEKANWAAYQPDGDDVPDDVAGVVVDSPDRITFTLTRPYNPTWFTDNQLSQITPLPLAWDRTSMGAAAGSGGCAAGLYGTVDNQCAAVFTFLSEQSAYDPTRSATAGGSAGAAPAAPAAARTSFGSSRLWSVVDGPWRLSALRATGTATFVPNPHYSGPVKPTLARFVERAFSSEGAEFTALASGQLSVGYLPAADVTAGTSNPLQPAPNNPQLAGYTLTPFYASAIAFISYNFQSSGDGGNAGAIFDQHYFRQAMQDLVDQPSLIAQAYQGYGLPDYGPLPPSPGGSSNGPANPYPYDPGRAVSLLQANGWRVVAGGKTTCRKAGTGPGECGTGIAAGAPLSFTVSYPAGVAAVRRLLGAEQTSWSQAGIEVTPVPATAAQAAATSAPCPSGCPWELADWGAGWLFSPDHYPSGEDLFRTGASSNAGSFSDPAVDADIAAGIAPGSGSLTAYRRAVATRLPVIFQPVAAAALTEVRQGLTGVTPQDVFGQLTPEAWRWG